MASRVQVGVWFRGLGFRGLGFRGLGFRVGARFPPSTVADGFGLGSRH